MNKETAFPVPVAQRGNYGITHSDHRGMTLRDYFAAKALQGICARVQWSHAGAATDAYAYADAMMKAREQ